MEFGVLMMDAVTSRAQWRDRVRRMEDDGLSTLHATDHFDRAPISPLLALAAAAQVTSRIRLGTLVLNNDFRQPAVLAKEIASLSVLCDGRLEIGIGAGWMDDDYDVSGIVREPAGRRIDRLGGTLELLRALSGGGAVDLDAPGVAVRDLRNVPDLVAPLRLFVGGGGRRVLTLAGRTADVVGINFDVREGKLGAHATASASADATDEKVGWVRAAAGDREPLLHLVAYWSEVTEDPQAAAARRITALGLDLTPDQLLASPHALIGPKGAVLERLAELRERWGFGYVSFYEQDLPSMLPVLDRLA
ncbi:MAG: TIGR03621 family F420-dependent LLM class oxidoreductase [Pseudonocardia sp.]|uniref:TIGR03621 family F420-dependent LLM class oxidoreductase n=1 Tax=Pseudonocardia sp. TaxID=60912 RepID=UPI001AD3EB6D|nr:TIGR03621 family F420-dependent LLM class oxidoreductase [Pseudonocardia sp.]MBN9109264.1 TIGR03621 family F420-dependent LLM class oxidoreductase [Pseudonocardia sp.]